MIDLLILMAVAYCYITSMITLPAYLIVVGMAWGDMRFEYGSLSEFKETVSYWPYVLFWFAFPIRIAYEIIKLLLSREFREA